MTNRRINRDELLQRIREKGFLCESKWPGCGQCTIYPLIEYFEIDESIFKSASALGGGFAATCEGLCGTLCCGSMVISNFFGRPIEEKENDVFGYRAGKLSRELREKFIQKYDGYTCKEIQKAVMGRAYNLRIPEEKEMFIKAGGYSEKCSGVVGDATVWVAEILLDNGVSLKNYELL